MLNIHILFLQTKYGFSPECYLVNHPFWNISPCIETHISYKSVMFRLSCPGPAVTAEIVIFRPHLCEGGVRYLKFWARKSLVITALQLPKRRLFA